MCHREMQRASKFHPVGPFGQVRSGLRNWSVQRQVDGDGGGVGGGRFHRDGAVVGLNDPLGNAQAKAATFDGAVVGGVAAKEPVEDARERFGRDAR